MKEFFIGTKQDKTISLSIYLLPKVIYTKYSILALFLIILINVLNIFFITELCIKFDIIIGDTVSMVTILACVFLTIYVDLDFLHAKMKKQFIEITNENIRVKKFISEKTLNWSQVKSVEELYSVRFHILTGVKLKKRNKNKKSSYFANIVINFNKYANIDIEKFIEVLCRKKKLW